LALELKIVNNIKNLYLIFLILTASTSAISAATIAINKKDMTESYSETLKVSGSFHLGMQSASDDKIQNLNILFPKDAKGWLCVDIASIDGKYKASIEHELTVPVSELNQLDYRSTYEKQLEGYTSNDLAVLASLKVSCKDQKNKRLIASWGPKSPKDNVILLIRSDARKDVVIFPDGKKIKCKKIREKYKVTFDKYCDLSGIDITKFEYLDVQRKNLQPISDERIELGYK